MFNIHNSYYAKFILFIFVSFTLILIVMTSKEFKRKCSYFAPLDYAAFYFSSGLLSYIYRISVLYIDGDKVVYYRPSYHSVIYDYSCVSHLYFDRFSRTDFLIQFGYFKSFVSKLTPRQLFSLKCSPLFINLLKMCNYEKENSF